MNKPKIKTQTKGHWHMVIEFENGNEVMICDASDEPGTGNKDIIITAIHRSDTPILYRTYEDSERHGIKYRAEEKEVIGQWDKVPEETK